MSMADSTAIGLVGAGHRIFELLKVLYDVRDRRYVMRDREVDDEFWYSYGAYHEHADEFPAWETEVSDLSPSIVAIFDPSAESREQVAALCRDHGDEPNGYDSVDAFLDADEYDAVIVGSPNYTHVESVIPLMEREIDVLCEKPIATTLEDHDRIIDAANNSDGLFYTGFNLRTAPYFVRLKELLSNEVIGQLGMISCDEVRGPFDRGYRYSQEKSGGSILEKNCHDFDLFNWYAESDPVAVNAFGGQHVFKNQTDTVDQATITVEYESGLVATLELCLYAPFDQRVRSYEFRGSEGVMRSPEQEGTIDTIKQYENSRISVNTEDFDNHMGGDRLELVRFLRCLRGEAEPPANPIDAKKASAIGIGAERSIQEGATVEIDDNYDIRVR